MSRLPLHTRIRQIIDQHGLEVITDLRLLYILSDYGVFDKLTDDHDIVKDLLSNGFGQLLIDCKRDNETNWQNKVNEFLNSFQSGHPEYDNADVILIADSIEFGVGLLEESDIRKKGTIPPVDSATQFIDYDTELSKLKNEYVSQLEALIVVPKGSLFKKPSGYYPIEAQNILYVIRSKICLLGDELGQDLRRWCEEEKQRVLNSYTYSVQPQRIALLSTIIVPSVIFAFLIIRLVSYIKDKEAIDSFQHTISEADSCYQAKNYEEALGLYIEASDTYKAPYRYMKYMQIAKDGVNNSSIAIATNLLDSSKVLYEQKNYYQVRSLILDLPEGLDCSSNKEVSQKLKSLRTDVDVKCDAFLSSDIEDIIQAIAKNKGKVSSSTMKQIDYLLQYFPDNYWLNFVKNKTLAK